MAPERTFMPGKGTTCSECGYRSTSAAIFRREGRRSFCLACAPYATTRRQKLGYVAPPVLLVMGAVILAAAGNSGVGNLGRFFIFLGLFHSVYLSTAIVHELGHAAAGAAIGMRVLSVTIGSGPVLWIARRRRPAFVLRRFLLDAVSSSPCMRPTLRRNGVAPSICWAALAPMSPRRQFSHRSCRRSRERAATTPSS
jgi:hypothetical protein